MVLLVLLVLMVLMLPNEPGTVPRLFGPQRIHQNVSSEQ
jgi:hypothetical protein